MVDRRGGKGGNRQRTGADKKPKCFEISDIKDSLRARYVSGLRHSHLDFNSRFSERQYELHQARMHRNHSRGVLQL